MSNLAHQLSRVIHCGTKAQFAGIKLGQQAVMIHELKRILAARDERIQIVAYSLNQAHMRVVCVAAAP